MKFLLVLFFVFISFSTFSQKEEIIITSDIDHFWEAYDKVITTKDSTEQRRYINSLFIEKGTPGLKGIMQARRYTTQSYVDAINHYPLFWQSVRANTLRAKDYAKEIESGIEQLRKLYPELKPAKIYFTIGALRTGGTTLEDMVLIGCEISMTDKTTNTEEFSQNFAHLRPHFDSDPIREIVFLNLHEYIHTQQKTTIGETLLSQCLVEGVAEFIATLAAGKESPNPCIIYGKEHDARIREVFSKEIASYYLDNWIWNDTDNEFGTRDLGYYVGYAICKKFYDMAKDKKSAIKEMIQLDYNNMDDVARFVDQSGYFDQPYAVLKAEFDKTIPTMVGIREFKNGQQNVDPGLTTMTIEFSTPMDKRFRSVEIGPLGEDHLIRIEGCSGFSEDVRSITYTIRLQPGQHHQLVVNNGFRSLNGGMLEPVLIDIRTK